MGGFALSFPAFIDDRRESRGKMAKLPKSNPLDADRRLAGHEFFYRVREPWLAAAEQRANRGPNPNFSQPHRKRLPLLA